MSSKLRSMTGFGSGAAGRARVELRAVNHRFLQLKVRLPSSIASLEGEFEAIAKKCLSRGSVQGGVVIDAATEESRPTIDRECAERLLEEAEQLGGDLGLGGRLSLAEVLELPGVVRVGAPRVDEEALAADARDAFATALDALVEMREREGAALAADLRKNLDALEVLVRSVSERSPQSVREHQVALRARVEALLGPERPLEEKDLAREIALLADKLDVAEETSRLTMHIEQLRELIDAGGGIGRKLDFLVQECLREVNTIGSKCNDAEIARAVVDAKTHVERLREQVQNVE